MKLIDADKRIAEIKEYYCTDCENYGGAKCRACWVDDAICLIEDATTADAVEVVRCRYCRHWDVRPINGRCTLGKCLKLSRVMGDTSFCSYGERKDGDGDG